MSAVQVRVSYKNVCYTSNLVGPKAHNTTHVTLPWLKKCHFIHLKFVPFVSHNLP